ncbi:MAG: c-type cytochrome [Saprospiraceae bacterium]|nr:c-type cytochrome [Saprospiraceae bacterium]
MKRILKFAGYLVVVVVVGIALLLTYVKTMLPDVGNAPDLNVEKSEAQIERGRYLANHVMVCMDCHSKRDWTRYSGPLVEGTLGQGGEVFDQNMGFPGKFVASNISPHGVGNWTDGEIFRAVASGVGRDGRPLFPIMPYPNAAQLDESDIHAVIAYLRTLAPVANDPPASKADFPMNFIIHTIPAKPNFQKMPPASDRLAHGRYLVTAAGCRDCHTRQEKGKFVGPDFGGGFAFHFPDGSVTTSSNITPHATGIGNWPEEQFVMRFKQYVDSGYVAPRVAAGEKQTPMPWTMYAGMTNEDLSAMYAYLKTLTPVDNSVVQFTSGK